MCIYVHVCMLVCGVCVCACVRACVHACVYMLSLLVFYCAGKKSACSSEHNHAVFCESLFY